jgi:hypothetical protein
MKMTGIFVYYLFIRKRKYFPETILTDFLDSLVELSCMATPCAMESKKAKKVVVMISFDQ